LCNAFPQKLLNQIILNNSILIVDPSTTERQNLRELLKTEYTVFESNTYEEAILSLSTNMPNMIILRNASSKAEDQLHFIQLVNSDPIASSIIFLVEVKDILKKDKLNLLKSGIVEILDQSTDHSILQGKIKNLFAIKNLNEKQQVTYSMVEDEHHHFSVEEKKRLQFENMIKDCIDHDHEVDFSEIATKLNFSLRSFERFVKKTQNTTPVRYVLNKRLEKAYILLNENKLSIKNIAYQVGFSSITYFNKCFKMIHGVPPGVVQKQKTKT
jgi:AraC-like DNA-binding protein